jgi:LysM repeat protein
MYAPSSSMDTISRENNSMLPVGSIIVGVVALLLGGFALVQASKANKILAEHQTKIDKIDSIEQQATNAQSAAEKGAQNLKQLNEQTQNAFNTVSSVIANLQGSVTKLEEAQKKPVVAAGGKKGSKEPVVAGPDEYVVKKGDVPKKIAAEHHCTVADLQAVNPGVNWNKLAAGQKIKLPAKK